MPPPLKGFLQARLPHRQLLAQHGVCSSPASGRPERAGATSCCGEASRPRQRSPLQRKALQKVWAARVGDTVPSLHRFAAGTFQQQQQHQQKMSIRVCAATSRAPTKPCHLGASCCFPPAAFLLLEMDHPTAGAGGRSQASFPEETSLPRRGLDICEPLTCSGGGRSSH